MTNIENKFEDEEKSGEDLAPKKVYPAIARALLYEMHDNLLNLAEESLKKIDGPKTLVIVGPGTETLPYSENLERVVRMVGDGNIVLMDYNRTICDKIPEYLKEKGFDKKFSIENVEGSFDPREKKNTIFVQTQNIMDGYTFPEESVSFIDMTVAVHHATQYESDILAFCKEAYKKLQKGGYLQIGEGRVDMKYSEKKLQKIAEDILASGEKSVKVVDERYSCKEPRMWNFGEKNGKAVSVYITNKGMVNITEAENTERLYDYLENDKKGDYKQLFRQNGQIIMPFIDASREEDFQGMIVPVRNYYSGKGGVIETTLKKIDAGNREAFMKAILKEQSDAERGLVEFYSLPSMVRKNLEKAGFVIEEMKETTVGPFVNILARKPYENENFGGKQND